MSDQQPTQETQLFFCSHCERILCDDCRYCPFCGFRRKGLRMRPLRGFTVLYLLLAIGSIIFLGIGFRVFDTFGALGTVMFSLGTALGPVALVGLAYEHLLKESLREAALRSYSEFSETAFQASLNSLNKQTHGLEDLTKRLLHIGDVGLIGAFPERRYAFPYIEDALAAEGKEIFIVGTSFRGLLWPTPGEERIMRRLGEKIRDSNCSVRFILTHPAFAHLRQSLEVVQRRETFHIAQEILETVKILRDAGVNPADIRFARGTPTIFGFMTSKMMLLNPYPLQHQAFTSLTVVLDSNDGENPVYRSFERGHFRGVWEGKNVDTIDSFDIVALQKVFDQSLETLKLSVTDKKIDYQILNSGRA